MANKQINKNIIFNIQSMSNLFIRPTVCIERTFNYSKVLLTQFWKEILKKKGDGRLDLRLALIKLGFVSNDLKLGTRNVETWPDTYISYKTWGFTWACFKWLAPKSSTKGLDILSAMRTAADLYLSHRFVQGSIHTPIWGSTLVWHSTHEFLLVAMYCNVVCHHKNQEEEEWFGGLCFISKINYLNVGKGRSPQPLIKSIHLLIWNKCSQADSIHIHSTRSLQFS